MANLKKGGGRWPSKIGISQSGLASWRATESRLSSAWLRRRRQAEAGGGIRFVLEDGRKFKSASSAASAVVGGKAVNGWRFWSVQGTKPQGKEGGREKPETQASKAKRLVYRVPNQKGIAEGQSRWFCRACMKGFVIEGGGQPEACPAGHRDDPELTAAVGPAEEASA